MRSLFLIAFLSLLAIACNTSKKETTTADSLSGTGGMPAITGVSDTLPLDRIKLPEGFKIEIYAEVENARSMVLSPSGTLFVGNRNENKVYALKDTDGDFKADVKWIIADSLEKPNGVAFKDGDLYVAQATKITKYPGIESLLDSPPAPVTIYDKFPVQKGHSWKYIAFGPDGKLYVPVGAPGNIVESEDSIHATITRMNPDGTGLEIFAKGVRNTVGFTWHPETKELWFTDNGRDMLGDDVPPCELNTAPKSGMHFGYPYCQGGTIKDPDFGNKRPCSDFTPPAQPLGAHVAPLGLKFYTGEMFPEQYKNQIILAEHGSWNRSKKSGYKLSNVKISGSKGVAYDTFASGWLNEETQQAWGRPVDVLLLPDGSMLVSDDFADVIYRISYTK